VTIKATYPNLPWDNQVVHKARIAVQKPKSEEEFWAYYILRRISIYFSILFSRLPFPFSSPNFITILGIISMLLATGLVITGSKVGLLIACLLYQVGYLFDCIDGEVARLTNNCSRLGKTLDMILDGAGVILLFGFAFASFSGRLGARLSLFWFLFIIFSGLFGFAIPRLLGISKITTRERHSSVILDIISFLISPPGLYTVLLIPILFGVAITFLLKTYSVGLSIKTLIKVWLIVQDRILPQHK